MKDHESARRRGPRRDGLQAREAILAAARDEFAAHGYGGATLRAIARAAGVDVALVAYYFGSKGGLFVASLRLPVNPADVLDELVAQGARDLGRRALERLLSVWDNPQTGGPLISVLRSATGQPDLLHDFVEGQIMPRIVHALDGPDAQLRAAAFTSQVLGVIFHRYVLRVEPMASASREDIIELMGPTLQSYVTPDRVPTRP